MGFSVHQIFRPVRSSVSCFSRLYINPLITWGHPYLRRLVSINLSLDTLSVEICRNLYISQVIFCGILLACIQAVLMLRGTIHPWSAFRPIWFLLCCVTVYAFYIQDRRVAYVMVAILIAELGSMPAIIYKTIPNNTGVLCMVPIGTQEIMFFGSVFFWRSRTKKT